MLTVAGSYKSFAAEIALLEGGANPNFTDHTGLTPLHVAAEAGAVDLVKELVAKGANLNARTYKASGPKSKFAQYFVNLRLSGEVTPLLLATKADHVDVMHVLIEAGADPGLKAQDGTTLLLAAAGSGHVDAARYAYQFDKDVKAVDDSGRTAMHMSMTGTAQIEQPVLTELVQYLADIGVPMDELDKRGRTPIQVGDGVPIDQPIQRMADIIVNRGGTPRHFPKEYVKPGPKAEK
jgi:ankyrin repeat protein